MDILDILKFKDLIEFAKSFNSRRFKAKIKNKITKINITESQEKSINEIADKMID